MRLEWKFPWGTIWGLTAGGVAVMLVYAAIAWCAPSVFELDEACPSLCDRGLCSCGSACRTSASYSQDSLLSDSRRSTGRIVLFGPPGVGKRTCLQVASMRGLKTVDLVPTGRNYGERKAAAFRMWQDPVDGVELYGAADLRNHDVPTSGYETVLLLPSRSEYLRRYEECI